jgi:hypothetical protein
MEDPQKDYERDQRRNKKETIEIPQKIVLI